MDATKLRISHNDLFNLVTAILQSYGLPEDDADIAAEHMVAADLRGVNTHGVIRLTGYINRIQAGGNNPQPEIKILSQTGNTALMDGDNSFGQVGGKRAMQLAIEKAEKNGVSLVTMRNSNHYGMAGYYALMAVRNNMIGITMTNVLAGMAPTGGTTKNIGNNPIAFAFPTGLEPPVVVDFATSRSSWGKALLCAQSGEPLPENCFTDIEGQPTRSAEAFLKGGALMPIAGHKGYGLALAISLLTGLLADAGFDTELPHLYNELGKPGGNSFTMGAIRVNNFQPVDRFKKRLDSIIRQIRSSDLASGTERVYLPGEIEHEKEREQRKNGILMKREMIEELIELAGKAGLSAKEFQKLLG